MGSLHRFDPLSFSELQGLGHTSHEYMRDPNEGSSEEESNKEKD